MDRREMLGMFGAGAVGLAALGGREARADHENHDHKHDKHIETIGHCAKVCNEAAHHCLDQLSEGKGDIKHHARAHGLAMDCQAFCVLTAALMARSSPLASYQHAACAEACRSCAEECEKSKGEHKIMEECAKSCRECEKICREMAKAMKSSPTATR